MVLTLQNNIHLAQYTTFKIGGPAKFFAEVKIIDELKEALGYAREKNLKIFVLGDASNVLFSDEGFDGLVILLRINELRVEGTKIIAGAGASVEDVLNLAIEHGLAELEWAGGLPGTVGGGVRGNAGAFGGEIKDVIELVKTIDQNGNVKTYTNSQCQFGYRDSIFKHNNEIVIEATFSLRPGNKSEIKKIAEDHIQYRQARHPLEYGNAGSIFKNTSIEKLSKELKEKWQSVIKTDPFPIVPTAAIIADSGLAGYTIGKAQVSTKHTNYIVNLGGATAQNVKDLIAHIKKTVKEKFDIELETEVQIV